MKKFREIEKEYENRKKDKLTTRKDIQQLSQDRSYI